MKNFREIVFPFSSCTNNRYEVRTALSTKKLSTDTVPLTSTWNDHVFIHANSVRGFTKNVNSITFIPPTMEKSYTLI